MVSLLPMGLIAEYLLVDEQTLDSLLNLGSEARMSRVVELTENTLAERLDIDKLWDALHCFLTGVSATSPLAGNKLSESIVGVHNFGEDDENADFIACIEHQELPGILAALMALDFKKLAAGFQPALLQAHNVYPPGIWQDDRQQLLAEMQRAIGDLRIFYEKALVRNCHVLVSIL